MAVLVVATWRLLTSDAPTFSHGQSGRTAQFTAGPSARYPRHVLLGREVKARLELMLRERVAAAVDCHMSELWRQSRWPLELRIGPPPARQRKEIGQILEIRFQRGSVQCGIEREIHPTRYLVQAGT